MQANDVKLKIMILKMNNTFTENVLENRHSNSLYRGIHIDCGSMGLNPPNKSATSLC